MLLGGLVNSAIGPLFDHESKEKYHQLQQEAAAKAMQEARIEQMRKAQQAKASKDVIDGEYEVVREVKGIEYVGW